MLSINIPVYNIEVANLVLALQSQAVKLNVPFEIRVYDDGSSEAIKNKNREISRNSNIIYYELKENAGRAAIRNKMGKDSNFEWQLFIDADSKVISENYLENYLRSRKKNCVLCGGTAYSHEKPKELEKLLRWFYGTKREAISADIRNQKKGFIITSNNFMIERKIFDKVHFREDIRNYGHEDTVLGCDLYRNGIEVFHIDNPLEHTGLEDATTLLRKTKVALENLHFISTQLIKESTDFESQVWFLSQYKKITRFVPPVLFRIFYCFFNTILERNLKGENPRLFWFDLYKISYYSTIKKS